MPALKIDAKTASSRTPHSQLHQIPPNPPAPVPTPASHGPSNPVPVVQSLSSSSRPHSCINTHPTTTTPITTTASSNPPPNDFHFRSRSYSRSSSHSPERPPVSPITPPPPPRSTSPRACASHGQPTSTTTTTTTQPSSQTQSRPQQSQQPKQPQPIHFRSYTFIHSQPPQVAMSAPPAPPPHPISFDDNPDVLAVQSAIGVLQLQRKRAIADICLLQRAKQAALADPARFVDDLHAIDREERTSRGRMTTTCARSAARTQTDNRDGDAAARANATSCASSPHNPGALNSPDDEGDEDDDEEMPDASTNDHPSSPLSSDTSSSSDSDDDVSPKPHLSQPPRPPGPRLWRSLPRPQNIVRCPPINWAQYAVVGESLNRLHAEQVAAPSGGVPLQIGADGRIDFECGGGGGGVAPAGGGEEGTKYVGVAAPYSPWRDMLEEKKR